MARNVSIVYGIVVRNRVLILQIAISGNNDSPIITPITKAICVIRPCISFPILLPMCRLMLLWSSLLTYSQRS